MYEGTPTEQPVRLVTRRRARRVLNAIIGEPILGLSMAVDMAMFSIGSLIESTDRKGEVSMNGEYSLHIQCPWRIVSGRLLFGYRDFARRDPHAGSSDPIGVALAEFLAPRPKCVSIQLRSAGSLVVGLTDHQSLEVFPHGTSDEYGSVEFWRYLNPAEREAPHLVCENIGYYLI